MGHCRLPAEEKIKGFIEYLKQSNKNFNKPFNKNIDELNEALSDEQEADSYVL
ncbi:hypothetical protein GCM10011405_10020 [Rufibacter glacialis]|nr:hypothetical protein GCM10011405_10020 [Rufibacter glacialis]